MHTLGKVFQVNIYGESHGDLMALTINGIAPGIKLDLEQIKADLSSRRPKLKSETSRHEADEFKITSGYFNGYTTGAPLMITLENKNVNSKAYDHLKDVFRPMHADYPAHMHYQGFNDYRGGGIFSGRLTALLTIAGSIAKGILSDKGISIITRIKTVKDQSDTNFSANIEEDIQAIKENLIPVIATDFQRTVFDIINNVKAEDDSLGAILESKIVGLEAGLGEPHFNKLDANLAYNIMTIPAIKGVSFGSGFDLAKLSGSQIRDEYYLDQDQVKTKSNHMGGIIGGMATGMPVIINSIVKPTPSINLPLTTIKKDLKTAVSLSTKGRHDSSIFTRIPIVVDALIALTILDMYCIRYGYMYQIGDKK
ncbi:MAG: chorismate synthase [Erysipelothrix sp.]|nr:chorismate synthase [Erysipelothrix sp.]